MAANPAKIVLGSRSPRRGELLARIVPAERIDIVPPRSSDEPGFDGLVTTAEIAAQLTRIAAGKCDDVLAQLGEHTNPNEFAAVVTADTVIVAAKADGTPVVLGQPPADDTWQETVHDWFRRYYAGRTHTAATAFCVATPLGDRRTRVVESTVTFRPDVETWLEWYLDSGEPKGKAGGYAIQGAGSLFVTQVTGSLSNVVGLPLAELLDTFDEMEIDVD